MLFPPSALKVELWRGATIKNVEGKMCFCQASLLDIKRWLQLDPVFIKSTRTAERELHLCITKISLWPEMSDTILYWNCLRQGQTFCVTIVCMHACVCLCLCVCVLCVRAHVQVFVYYLPKWFLKQAGQSLYWSCTLTYCAIIVIQIFV